MFCSVRCFREEASTFLLVSIFPNQLSSVLFLRQRTLSEKRGNSGPDKARDSIKLARHAFRGRIMTIDSQNVTQLLRSWGDGNREALDRLTPLVYRELHKSAKRYMARENPGHTLQATALINEVYLRLIDAKQVDWQNRAHFFGVCAKMMRRILTDFARSRRYLKRGGNAPQVTLDEALTPASGRTPDLVALDDSLSQLAQVDPRKGQVVE